MKHILLTALMMMSITISGQGFFNELDKKLNGNVKSERVINYIMDKKDGKNTQNKPLFWEEYQINYDLEGNEAEVIHFSSKGKEMERVSIEPKEKKNIINGVYKDSNGNIVEKYNDKSQLIEEIFYFPEDYIQRTIYEYNIKGKLSKSSIYGILNGKEELREYIQYEYDEHNNIVKMIMTDKIMNEEFWIKYQYNELGDVISMEKDSEMVNFTYKYDSQNNWIERLSIVEGQETSLEKRTIEYYK